MIILILYLVRCIAFFIYLINFVIGGISFGIISLMYGNTECIKTWYDKINSTEMSKAIFKLKKENDGRTDL